MQLTFLIQAAAVAAASSGEGLSLGAWLGLIATGLSVAAMLIKFGELKANTKNLESNTNKALAEIRKNVEDELKSLTGRVEEILSFIHQSQQLRITDAGWQAETTAAITAAAKDATEAKDSAHRARNAVTEVLLTLAKGEKL